MTEKITCDRICTIVSCKDNLPLSLLSIGAQKLISKKLCSEEEVGAWRMLLDFTWLINHDISNLARVKSKPEQVLEQNLGEFAKYS